MSCTFINIFPKTNIFFFFFRTRHYGASPDPPTSLGCYPRWGRVDPFTPAQGRSTPAPLKTQNLVHGWDGGEQTKLQRRLHINTGYFSIFLWVVLNVHKLEKYLPKQPGFPVSEHSTRFITNKTRFVSFEPIEAECAPAVACTSRTI